MVRRPFGQRKKRPDREKERPSKALKSKSSGPSSNPNGVGTVAAGSDASQQAPFSKSHFSALGKKKEEKSGGHTKPKPSSSAEGNDGSAKAGADASGPRGKKKSPRGPPAMPPPTAGKAP